MTIRFSTTEFEYSHGRKPRGKGHWMFEVEGHADWVECGGSFTLTEAKRLMRRWCKREGFMFVTVKVLP